MATRTRKKTLYKGIDHLTPETRSLVIDKLTSSGLDLDDMQALGIEALEAKDVIKLDAYFKAVPSLKLNYFDPVSGEPLAPRPQWPAFYRLRYLETPSDFAALTDKKPQRYIQPLGSGLCAYFPKNQPDWPEVLRNNTTPLIITEGEFKAAKSCKEGYPCIGLGGVDSFKSTQLGEAFLAELEQVNWVKRHVYIIYDSDYRSNENVCGALNRLAEALLERGALPYVVPLPDVVEDGKTGLDDFLVRTTNTDELADLLRTSAAPLTLARTLWKLNDEVIYVHRPGMVIIRETNFKLSANSFTGHAFAAAKYTENVVNKDGKLSLRQVPAAMSWLQWPLRAEAGYMTYAPGKEKYIDHPSRWQTAWNIWPGWGVAPKKGDIKPFLKLVEHIFSGSTQEAVDWFLDWCAYPLQYPGTKLFSSVLIYGIKHGTGKSLIGYTMGRIYGQNFTEISGAELHGTFNEWAEGKQFVMGDDVTGSDKREDNDRLKKMITQKKLRLNPKFIPSYEVPDCINYFFTSNQPDAFFLEDSDRRFFIHEVLVDPLPEDFYVDYELWLDTGGAEAIFDFLLSRDVGSFNPAGHALMTRAKERMIHDVKSDLGAWVNRLVNDPDSVLKLGEMVVPGDLFTNRQLLEIYDPMQRTRTTANGLGRELRRSGVFQVADGAPIQTVDGQDRYYVIRNRAKWVKAKPTDATKYLNGLKGGDAKKPAEKKKPKY